MANNEVIMQEIRCFDRVRHEALGFTGTVVRTKGDCHGVWAVILPDPGEKVPRKRLGRYGLVQSAYTNLELLSRPKSYRKKKQLQVA